MAAHIRTMTKIFVSGQNLQSNLRGEKLPVYLIQGACSERWADQVAIMGESQMVYASDSLGARAWLETDAEISLDINNILDEAVTIVHVNRQHIAMNAKDRKNRPVFTIKIAGATRYARSVVILGPSRLVYTGSQLKCGARAWLETTSKIVMIDEMSYSEARS